MSSSVKEMSQWQTPPAPQKERGEEKEEERTSMGKR